MNNKPIMFRFFVSKKSICRVFFGIIVFLLTACAQIVTPTGGPRDVTPPKATKSVPPNNSIQFLTGTQIKITFDEYIEINNAGEKVMISHPLKTAPSYKVSGKNLIIEFNDTLKPNATYSLFFDNCIRDITENNAIPSFEYNFSTGNAIDSGVIKGTVIDAFTLKPEKQAYVLLYRQDNDTLPMTQRPYYLTKTNDLGLFTYTHISEGKYKLFALNDKNNNLLFDQFSERIGFSPLMVETGKSDNLEIKMFSQADTAQQILKKTILARGKLMIALKKEASNIHFQLKEGDFSSRFICEHSLHNDTVYLYDKYFSPDTITLYISDRQLLDTFVVSPSAERKSSRKLSESTHLSATVNDAKERYLPLMISFNAPLKNINNQKIKLYKLTKDTNEIPFNITYLDSIRKKIIVAFKKEEQQTYLLKIADSTFWSYNMLTNDSIKAQFTILTEDDYGNLLVHLDNKKGQMLIVQLLNEQNDIVKEQILNESGNISWSNLSPGTYQLKAIIDENKNKKWDTGNYFLKQLPERIIIFATPIQIRAKWDIEEKFIVD